MAQLLHSRYIDQKPEGRKKMAFVTNENIMRNVHIPVLKVLGMGGGGCNAVERMMEFNLRGIEFIVANTDHQALMTNSAPLKIHLGPRATRGLGAGGNPEIGRVAAEESRNEIAKALEGADIVFLTAGMGGGTGTGSIAVAAEIARAQGATVIAIVTTPFSFEMGKRQKNAREGLEKLRIHTHTLLTIPNDRLLFVAPRNLPIDVAFRLADDVLRQAVQGISEIIYEPGLINVDFAHVQRLIRLGGGALMAIGQGHGENKIHQALEQALHHPLLEDVNLYNAAGIIANFTAGDDLALSEIDEALRHLQAQTGPQTEIVMGVIIDPQLQRRVQVILMITGLGSPTLEEAFMDVQKSAEQKRTPIPQTPVEAHPQTSPLPYEYEVEPMPVTMNERTTGNSSLDIPAFLRKRSRLAVTTQP
jgi:cell division protein FtsZ